MPQIFSTSRAEAAVFRFPPLFFPIVFMLALVAQAYLPVVVHLTVYLDLPLLAVIYWAGTTRNQTSSSIVGAALGIAQDSVAHMALGLNGVGKTLIGFFTAGLGSRIDADHAGIRLLVVYAAYMGNRGVLYTFERFLLGTPIPWQGTVTSLAALFNAMLAIILFRGLDRFRHWV